MERPFSVSAMGGSAYADGQSKAFRLAESVCNALYENPLQREFHKISGLSKDGGKRLVLELAKADLIERSPVGSGRMLRLSPASQIERRELLQFLREKFMHPYGWILRSDGNGLLQEAPPHVRKCLIMKLAGYSNKDIAARHELTLKTVETYLRFVNDPEGYKESRNESSASAIMRSIEAEKERVIETFRKRGFFVSASSKMHHCRLVTALDLESESEGFRLAILPTPKLLFFRLAGRLVIYGNSDKLASTLAVMYDAELRRRAELPTRIMSYTEKRFIRSLNRRTMAAFGNDREAGEKVVRAINEVLRKTESKPFVTESQ